MKVFILLYHLKIKCTQFNEGIHTPVPPKIKRTQFNEGIHTPVLPKIKCTQFNEGIYNPVPPKINVPNLMKVFTLMYHLK